MTSLGYLRGEKEIEDKFVKKNCPVCGLEFMKPRRGSMTYCKAHRYGNNPEMTDLKDVKRFIEEENKKEEFEEKLRMDMENQKEKDEYDKKALLINNLNVRKEIWDIDDRIKELDLEISMLDHKKQRLEDHRENLLNQRLQESIKSKK